MPFKPNWRVPPGETIKDAIEERGLTRADLADRLGLNRLQTGRLLTGTIPLTPDIARRLQDTLGISAQFWLNMEANYRKPIEGGNDGDV